MIECNDRHDALGGHRRLRTATKGYSWNLERPDSMLGDSALDIAGITVYLGHSPACTFSFCGSSCSLHLLSSDDRPMR